jgi:acyl-CoA synthetase (AMP-forming)/AMP-acid ligase II
MWESNTLTHHLEKMAQANLNKNAYLFVKDNHTTADEAITYNELILAAKKVAAFLSSEKLSGEKVILCYSTGINFIINFLACLYANVTAVVIPYVDNVSNAVNKKMLSYVQDAIETKMIFAESDTIQKLGIDAVDIQKIKNSYTPFVTKNEASTDTITHMLLTSGSTSDPKIVAFNHKCLLHNLYYTSTSWLASSESIFLTWGNAFHSAGLMVGYLLPIFNGATGVIFPAKVFQKYPLLFPLLVSKYQVTHTACPNFVYDYLLQYINSNQIDTSKLKIDLSKWTISVVGGDPLQDKTLYKFHDYFKHAGFELHQFRTAYGMTEATGLITTTMNQSPVKYAIKLSSTTENKVAKISENTIVDETVKNKPELCWGNLAVISCGYTSCGVEVVIVDPDSCCQVKSDHTIGDIYFSSPSLFKGYWNKKLQIIEDASISLPFDNQNKYLSTGDKGFMIENELFVLGRDSEIINKNNKIYYPLFIELIAVNAVQGLRPRSNIAFMIIEGNTQKIILVQELEDEMMHIMKHIENAIKEMVAKHYGLYLDIVVFIKINSLPKIPGSGKMQRNLCKKQYLDNQLSIICKESYENITA